MPMRISSPPRSGPAMVESIRGGGITWLASYPKSGNTWMRMLLANYFGDSGAPHDINTVGVTNGIASWRHRFDEILGIPSNDLTPAEARPLRPHVYRAIAAHGQDPVWMKVHDAQERLPDGQWLFPPDASHAAIYLIRNPLDVAVSYGFHSGEPVDMAVDWLCDPGHIVARDSRHQLPQFTGSWSDHVTSWVDQTEIPVCVIRYEDMLADTAGQLARALAFARSDLSVDARRASTAVEQSRFETLQAAEVESGFREKNDRAARFFRSGRANDWHDHLTPTQTRRICAEHRETMLRFGYDPDVA